MDILADGLIRNDRRIRLFAVSSGDVQAPGTDDGLQRAQLQGEAGLTDIEGGGRCIEAGSQPGQESGAVLQVEMHMGAVVIGVHIANTRFAGHDIVGFLGFGFVGNDTLVVVLDLVVAITEHGTGGLLLVVGVGGMIVNEIDTCIQDDQGLIGLAALGHIIGVHFTALGSGQFLGSITGAAHHKAAVLHQGDVPGTVLHIVHFVTGLIATGFLSRQILGIVVDIAATVLALGQHADTRSHGQHIAFPGVGTGHVEILGSVGTFALHDALIVGQLVIAVRGQHQQVDLFNGLAAVCLIGLKEVCLLAEIADNGRFRHIGLVGFRLQLGQNFVGTVGVINRIHQSADRSEGNECHEHKEG